MSEIKKIEKNKKKYLPLLLLGDDQESMIDRYLERGDTYVLFVDGGVVAICVVTHEESRVIEIKNIAVVPEFQRQGYGRRLIDFVIEKYQFSCDKIIVGTGETFSTLSFYKKCGFEESHRVCNFFKENYDHPIIEDGVELVDMVYLSYAIEGTA